MHVLLRSLGFAVVALPTILAGPLAPLGAQEESPWSIELEQQTVELVATKWGVDPERIVMSWGPYRGVLPGKKARVVLLGTGRGGHWVARAELWNGTTVSVRLRTGRKVDLPVAARKLKRGEIITDLDIIVAERVVWQAPGEDEQRVSAGWEVQRTIEEGRALRPPAVRLPFAVLSGRNVQIVWTRGTVGLRAPARAAGSGAIGDQVFVRTGSGARLSGIVVAPGVVDVTQASLERGSGGAE